MSIRPLRLLVVGAALAAFAVALAVWAVSAYQFKATAEHWPTSLGTVIQPDPHHAPAVRFADTAGTVHLMALHQGDTDDLPVGAKIRVSYELAAGGRLRSEFKVQPGARASALTVLTLLSLAGSGVAIWRWRATTEGRPA